MAAAFRASDHKLSVWHKGRVEDRGNTIDDLKTGALDGFGDALLTVGACTTAAGVLPDSSRFDPSVLWRPEEADQERADWSDAHANIESKRGDPGFPRSYRRELAKRCVAKAPKQL